jgi:membrane glycosyltransferase
MYFIFLQNILSKYSPRQLTFGAVRSWRAEKGIALMYASVTVRFLPKLEYVNKLY